MKLRLWTKQKNNVVETHVMRDGQSRSAATPQEYLLDKLHDNFDAARECIAFIDRKRDEHKKLS